MANTALREILDSDQYKAVSYRGSNLLIVAGAGSGKTRTLALRALSFVYDDGIDPSCLMAITFTRKAADELRKRMDSYLPESGRAQLAKAWIGTIHSICWRLLREYGSPILLPGKWQVLNSRDSERVLNRIINQNLGNRSQREVTSIRLLISYHKNTLQPIKECLSLTRFETLRWFRVDDIERVIADYKSFCQNGQRVDFDDLQRNALELLQSDPATRTRIQEKFRAIFVDEFQDTNRVQKELLMSLHSDSNTITVVGDDAQAIYGFRGASIDNIKSFDKDFRSEIALLHQNYRSTSTIVEVANKILINSDPRFDKSMRSVRGSGARPILIEARDLDDEAKHVVDHIVKLMRAGISFSEQAVIFRNSKQVAAVELVLKQRHIPYVQSGAESFFERNHIKLAIELARLLTKDDDQVARSIVEEILEFESSSDNDGSDFSSGEEYEDCVESNDHSVESRLDSGDELVRRLRLELQSEDYTDRQGLNPSTTLRAIAQQVTEHMRKRQPFHAKEIEDDLLVLTDLASQFRTLSDLIDTIALDSPDSKQNEEALALVTVHSAKGLEWKAVHLIGLLDGWFPNGLAIKSDGGEEEERRLFYVAITRAMDFLTCSYAKVIEDRLQSRSRFLSQIPDHLFELIKTEVHR